MIVRPLCRCAAVLLLLVSGIRAEEQPATLVYATLQWTGKYRTEDVAHGVKQTPATAALYRINTDGTGKGKVVDLGGTTTYPFWCSQTGWLYFQSNGKGPMQVYRCRADGSEVTNLSALHQLGDEWATAYGYALSGDGSKLVYTVHNGEIGRVVYCNADGTDAQWVAPELGYTYMASLDHEGKRIAFASHDQEYRLMLAEYPFTSATMLTPDHPTSFVPQFTPDGKTLVFIRRDGDVYSIDLPSKEVRQLTHGNAYVELHLSDEDQHGSTDGPSISPDGQHVAYIARKDGIPQVCTMKLDGSDQQQLTNRPRPCARVRWSPDGKQLAFVSFESGRPQLFVMNRDGSQLRRLTSGTAIYWVQWFEPSRESS